jgi:F-type H+-transporting ATPase subunit b
MPQLEQIHTFLGQIFWLFVTFGFLYVVLWKAALPRVTSILQERQERIDEDLRKAEEFKQEADDAIAAYEKLVADARGQAQAVIREASLAMAADSTARHDALSARIKADVAEAEARIDKARVEAVGNIQTVAAEVAQAATSRLIGKDVSTGDAEAAVASTLQERS